MYMVFSVYLEVLQSYSGWPVCFHGSGGPKIHQCRFRYIDENGDEVFEYCFGTAVHPVQLRIRLLAVLLVTDFPWRFA